MWFVWLVLGAVLGAAAVWYWREQNEGTRVAEVQGSWEAKYRHAVEDVKRADAAHEETKERLRAAESRVAELEAEKARLEARIAELEGAAKAPPAAPARVGAAPPRRRGGAAPTLAGAAGGAFAAPSSSAMRASSRAFSASSSATRLSAARSRSFVSSWAASARFTSSTACRYLASQLPCTSATRVPSFCSRQYQTAAAPSTAPRTSQTNHMLEPPGGIRSTGRARRMAPSVPSRA